jgi:hypothetical protein
MTSLAAGDATSSEAHRLPTESLIGASLAFLAANLLHGADHWRQGLGRLTTEVLVAGGLLTLLAFATVALALRHHPWAPLVAAAVGFGSAFGVAAAHLAPHWSAFSDSYPDVSVDALSWAIVLAEITTAFVLGLAAIRELRRNAEVRLKLKQLAG